VTFASSSPPWLQIWLEAGREGQVFTSANSVEPPAGIGDLVRVRLQGRLHTGLVVAALAELPASLGGKAMQPILAIWQRAAVDSQWQGLLESVAESCHTSLFKTLKSALPSGWLGQRSQGPSRASQPIWLVERSASPQSCRRGRGEAWRSRYASSCC